MKTVTFKLPIFNPFHQGPMRIGQHTTTIEMELTAGEHLFVSTPIEVGSFFHYTIFGHISIPYSYDPDTQYVTISGPEDISNKQLTIHTSLDQHPEITNSGSLNSTGNTLVTRNMWTDYIENTPAVKQLNQTVIRQAIDALVKELLDAGVQGVIQTGPAPIVNPHNYLDYKAMFAPNKAEVEQPSLNDIIEVQQSVQSTYYGTITWNLNYAFANIIGSTNDPKPSGYSSWIELWAITCNGGHDTTRCSSYNYSDGAPPFNCNTSDFVGGHVIPGTVAKKVAKGGTAYIFPICKRHNGNDNIYMSSRYNPVGVVLHNYNQ